MKNEYCWKWVVVVEESWDFASFSSNGFLNGALHLLLYELTRLV